MRPLLLACAFACGVVALGCAEPRAAPGSRSAAPWIVIGVDGGEYRVLERLWQQGELPNLRALADRGVVAPLATDYGASPVIWTTIATGVRPDRHGITDFVVATESGDVPVTSVARRVPALWNMLSRVRRRVAVLGWWATWPAEPVEGVVLSDRANLDLPGRIFPAELEPELREEVERAGREGLPFGGNPASEVRDRVVTRFARRAMTEGYDLVLAYYRSVDLVSHDSWRAFEPAAFGDPPAGAPGRDPVSAAYAAFDAAVGEIRASAPPGANFLVLSDHGFHATEGEQIQVRLDLDRVLEALGLLRRRAAAVDPDASQAYSFRSPDYRVHKLVRFTPPGIEPTAELLAGRTDLLAEALARVRFDGVAPAFRVLEPGRRERRRGGHAVVEVLTENATPSLRITAGPEVEGAVLSLGRITGSHDRHTAGILLAAGPAIDRGADLRGVSIHDVAPTLLVALGLPIAEDFAGRPRLELFDPRFRSSLDVRTVPTWGEREAAESLRSAADRELLEELAGLGYLR